MTGSELYDLTKLTLQDFKTPQGCYLRTRFIIHIWLMEEVPQPKVYRWKKTA